MKLNYKKITEWIAAYGPHGKEALSFKSGLGFYTIGRILRKDKQVTKAQIMALAQATGLSAEELTES